MEERIRFIDHQGKRVLLVDLSNCPINQVEKLVRSVPDYITVQPLGSVLVLTDFTGAAFDRDAIRAVKETAVFDKPFVKKSALIGTEDLKSCGPDDLVFQSVRDGKPLRDNNTLSRFIKPALFRVRFCDVPEFILEQILR
jgi:hypothetical protein